MKHPAVGLLNLISTSLTLGSPAESRVVVHPGTGGRAETRANVEAACYEHKPGLDHESLRTVGRGCCATMAR